ncbi:tRNA pseudouridine(38-40) synthase TruA [Amphibacillus sediminis]|uniref:tRNA pseudouridine(38-40) synthase TruA n=1 Tax=Amphibacillus sediminis TaxID=360185 RepID=UPI00082FB6E5|nr:tRNA pseudouridine(38-40) synthase TruA [Amphibacillus sediminis]
MRLLATVSYDGTRYAGYQVQPEQMTIQSTIEKALAQIHKGDVIKIVASGRTDAGVHAIGQTFHFDSNLTIPIPKWKAALNALLPNDILIKDVVQVADDFHARYDVNQKRYRYKIWNDQDANPFQRYYCHHVDQPLDLEAINRACQFVKGEHDFTSFCAANSNTKGSKVRKVFDAACERDGHYVIFTFTGNGFLYNMVRILVGTLIEVGLGQMPPEQLKRILASHDRTKAGKTAPAQGLYLDKVIYRSVTGSKTPT